MREPELETLRERLKLANQAHSALVSSVEEKILKRELPADTLIGSLWDLARNSNVGNDVVERARLRHDLGNPPGKRGSLGDAIHWECLLNGDEVIYNLDIVSRDGDFASDLRPREIKDFLVDEWKSAHHLVSRVKLFRSLSDYFKAKFPHIKLSDEVQKNDLIGQLQISPNFSTTHAIVEELARFEYFTTRQVINLFEALTNNTQVGWIGTDDDVKDFYMKLSDKADVVPDELHEAAAQYLEVDKDEFFLAVPF